MLKKKAVTVPYGDDPLKKMPKIGAKHPIRRNLIVTALRIEDRKDFCRYVVSVEYTDASSLPRD